MRMDTLTSIKVFRQIVESGSFVAAAEQMDLSTAMVSRHVMHIEKQLGVRLLDRNSRALSLTEPGRIYFERCSSILEELEATETELGSLTAVPRGVLRITCPTWFAGQRLADALAQFRRRYPEVIVDVSFDDRCVDLVEEGLDLALRVMRGGTLPPGLIARAVRPIRVFLAASHEYLKRRGSPRTPADLAAHDVVAIGNLNSIVFTGETGKLEVPVRVVLRYRSAGGVAHAVAAGVGLAPVPALFFEDATFREHLTPVLTDYPLQNPMLYLIYGSRRYLPLKIRVFVDFALQEFSALRAAG
jgi:DNA-binding transcriptional LysR family regulator